MTSRNQTTQLRTADENRGKQERPSLVPAGVDVPRLRAVDRPAELGERTEAPLRYASATGFAALLLLSVVWPAPVVWLNERTFSMPIAVGPHSFLGREAPSWDVVFWAIAGLYTLSLLHAGRSHVRPGLISLRADLMSLPERFARRAHSLPLASLVVLALGATVTVAATWIFFDGALVLAAELARGDAFRTIVRLLNRLGGGMNPAMIAAYFLIAGLILGDRRWSRWGLAMAVAGLASGSIAQVVKLAVDRSRPEMWLGPFHFAESASTSFPSGHTVGAFALAAVLVFGSRSPMLRIVAVSLAAGVGASRVIGFRHWPSDVLASAAIGLFLGWFVATALLEDRDRAAEAVPARAPEDRLAAVVPAEEPIS